MDNNIGCTLYSNLQYITPEACIVGHDISNWQKIVCIWEDSNKVDSNSYSSYLDGFGSQIIIFQLYPTNIYFNHIKTYKYPKSSLLDVTFVKVKVMHRDCCWENFLKYRLPHYFFWWWCIPWVIQYGIERVSYTISMPTIAIVCCVLLF